MPRPLVISSDKRTGSHFLQTGLDAHSAIYCRGERYRWPSNNMVPDEEACEDWFEKIFTFGDVEWSGVVLQRVDCGRTGPFQDLRNRIHAAHPDTRVIRLYRRNLFAQYVSWRMACERKMFNYYKGDKPLPDVRLAVQRRPMFRWLEATRGRWKYEEKEWSWAVQTVVHYEELVEDYAGVMARLFKFLELEYEDVEPLTLRANPKPLPEVVTNYEEAVTWLGEHPQWRYLVQTFKL